MSSRKLSKVNKFFQNLLHVEVSGSLPKNCFSLIVKNAVQLKTIKVFHVQGLKREDFEQVLNGPFSSLTLQGNRPVLISLSWIETKPPVVFYYLKVTFLAFLA
jgi:hypothetical protein